MKTSNYFILLVITLLLAFNVYQVTGSNDSSNQSTVYQIDIKEEISPGIARQVSKALIEANAQKADLVMVRMNTYGGLVDAADSIRTSFLNSKIPVIVFIDNNAASAGALISIACEKIYMRKGASIGAATVVTQNAEALPDKYQSYMRSMMRSTAEARGRDPRIAEAMVDPRIAIEGVNDSGKVLTLTSTEALKLNFCNGIAENEQEALALHGITNYKIISYHPSLIDRLIGWLMHPAISGVLILLMLGGLYYELQQPGIGFPLVIAVLAAIMYFAPLYLDGLAANWEILVSIIGILLIAAEIFVIPGFGIAGISGLVLLLFGLISSLLRNDGFDFSGVSTLALSTSIATVLLGMAGALVLFLLSSKVIASSPMFKKMVLDTQLSSGSGYSSAISLPEIGTRGRTATLLRPSGKVTINDHIYSASCESGFVEMDVEIEVVSIIGGNLIVRPV